MLSVVTSAYHILHLQVKRITTLSMNTLSITTLSKTILSNSLAKCCNAEHHYAECLYAECQDIKIATYTFVDKNNYTCKH